MNNIKEKGFCVGLALGCGGAKGFAHLGAMRALRENGVTFDVFAGTSIGSLIGAFFAFGYNENDVFELFKETLASRAMTVLNVMDGGLTSVINSALGGASFSDLKYPFAAVATELISGKEVVFTGGDLSVAVASSCAIPPTFSPVKFRDYQLIDGAYTNYVPSDRCVELGANAVLGINLGKERRRNPEGNRVLDEMYPYHNVPFIDRCENGYKYASFMIEPKLSDYNGFSINKAHELFDIGYEETTLQMPKIKNALSAPTFGEEDIKKIREREIIRVSI